MIAGHALGLTPLVFLLAALLFGLTAMTYVEGASLHQDRGGSTVFARYAFNELVSFIAGWAILLDYIILIAVTTYSATQYLKVFWHPLGNTDRVAAAGAGVHRARRARQHPRLRRAPRAAGRACWWPATWCCSCSSWCSGWCCSSTRSTLLDPIHLGSAPTWSDLVFALTVAVIAFTSLESAAGSGGGGADQPRRPEAHGRQRHRDGGVSGTSGIALVAVTALPVHDGHTELAGALS